MNIHPISDVQTSRIGGNTRIWQFVVILPGARIGTDCNICSHCLIENDVIVGDRVTIKSGLKNKGQPRSPDGAERNPG